MTYSPVYQKNNKTKIFLVKLNEPFTNLSHKPMELTISLNSSLTNHQSIISTLTE